MIMTDIGWKLQIRTMGNLLLRQQIGNAQMVSRKAGQHLFFRIKKFEPFAIISQTEADETVMNQPRHIGSDAFENLGSVHVW